VGVGSVEPKGGLQDVKRGHLQSNVGHDTERAGTVTAVQAGDSFFGHDFSKHFGDSRLLTSGSLLVSDLHRNSSSNQIEGVSEKVSSDSSETTTDELAELGVRVV